MVSSRRDDVMAADGGPKCLRQIDRRLWCLESYFVVCGCRGSVRMTAIETMAGLVLYSPVRLTMETVAQIESIGRVAVIVAPNLFHHLFLRQCRATFPEARVLIARGLEAKIGALPGAEEISTKTRFCAEDAFDHFVFDGHALHETVLFHRPTTTLITADLIYNFGPRQYLAERTFFRAIGCYGAPKVAFYHRYAIKQKQSVSRLVETVSLWQPRRIIMSHGDIIECNDAASLFAAAWAPFAD